MFNKLGRETHEGIYFVPSSNGKKGEPKMNAVQEACEKEKRKKRKKELEELYSQALKKADYKEAARLLEEIQTL
ncbi:hypothetical protein A2757_00205 [Candidatus Giovannonibacteria bacterium RIFCSPHIGHO2_01_FULL_48_47]|nr:MAG: hypothetical protein A2757_00205 [Candidatus Giovannonibacteria bacterium RIFCSPHIGHO2_01_FULL_48_47]OGF68913.1 MAG: hypothetical protein A3D61_03200 [Candidatus Giovannonibacteria bacterium RIFCSPHIGHO2_02_FULL_48_15]OGF95497.1 MAG: hypothetical protein A2433_01710 [Candidatus Giovannonibacteria bacterium RIFOXYC1_FULL_48_8]OGF96428.1 MAG: hypothetical protein A2613_02620 [Candidatus Giovannonibacteria bacterium RIFOXYD1_FULL_48_21]